MKRCGKKILYLLISVMVFSSCSSIYIPNAQNIPTFTAAKQWEATASAQMYTGGNVASARGLQALGAYSISNHLGVLASYFKSPISGEVRHFGEVGFGYYTNVKKFYLSAFVGYGLSSQFSDDVNGYNFDLDRDRTIPTRENATTYSSHSQNLFLQSSAGIRITDGITWLLALKINRVDFQSTYYGSQNSFVINEDYLGSYHLEPSSTVKFNFKKIPLSILTQTAISSHYGNHPYIPKSLTVISCGIEYRFSK